MSGSIKRIDARALKAALHGLEIAPLDAPEELTFGERHIFMAACLPLGRIEVPADDMVPRRRTRVVWCDDGGGLGERAAQRMADLAYSDVSVLDGGIAAWEKAGFRIYNGVHVPSKAFARSSSTTSALPGLHRPQYEHSTHRCRHSCGMARRER